MKGLSQRCSAVVVDVAAVVFILLEVAVVAAPITALVVVAIALVV
jgi:hypothetical protein